MDYSWTEEGSFRKLAPGGATRWRNLKTVPMRYLENALTDSLKIWSVDHSWTEEGSFRKWTQMNFFGHEVMLPVFAEGDITHVSVFSSYPYQFRNMIKIFVQAELPGSTFLVLKMRNLEVKFSNFIAISKSRFDTW